MPSEIEFASRVRRQGFLLIVSVIVLYAAAVAGVVALLLRVL